MGKAFETLFGKGLLIEMKKLKQTAAAVLALAVAAGSMSGCSSTDYAMTANGQKVNAGVYINYIMNEMTNQMYTMYYGGEITDVSECFDKQIDGKDFAAYVKDTALENTKEFAAITAKFDELGLELSEEDAAEIKDSVSSSWENSGEFYESEGISKESLTQAYELSYKRQAIFDYYYAEGGIEEVKTDEIQTFVNDNYIRYKSITVAKSTNEDAEAAETENAELKELIEEYLAEAEELDFEGFDTIIDEYAAYKEAQSAEETEDSADGDESAVTELDSSSAGSEDATADNGDESAEDTVDSEASDESVSDDSSTVDESSADDDSAADADTELDSGADGEDGESEEEEEDPYENETVINYTNATDSESDSYSESYAAMLKEFKDAEFGKAAAYDDENNYYLYITADIADRTDYVEDNRDTLLDEIKGDEFDELIDSWVEEMKIVLNDKAIKRYTVKEVYDRQNEYYSKQS